MKKSVLICFICKKMYLCRNKNEMNIYDTAQGRRSAILQQVRKDSSVNVSELSKQFGVSEVTIRKDLKILKERKLLVRVHGGAIMNTNVVSDESEERNIHFKMLVNSREKEAIGRAAAAHIKEGDTILLDAGTTTLQVAKNLDRFQDLTIITNSANIMMEALKYKRFKVILLGGAVREPSYATVGPLTESNLKLFYCDKLFLGVDSFSVEDGLSTPSVEEASTNQVMISRAREVIAIFDSSKVNKRAFAYITSVDQIDTIITDSHLSANVRGQLKSMKVNVEIIPV